MATSAAGPHTGDAASDAPQAPPNTAAVDDGQAGKSGGGQGAATTARPDSGVIAGAVAIVGVVVGLVSLSGGSIADQARERESILGQIASSTGGGGDQVAAVYTGPWHAAALVDGVFALLAVAIAGIAFTVGRKSAGWVRAVALAGIGIGVLGVLMSAGMYLDLFGSAPTMPQTPQMPGAGG